MGGKNADQARAAFEKLRNKIEVDPAFREGLRENMRAAVDRAGLTEELQRLRAESAQDQEICLYTCAVITCIRTCLITELQQ
ncbi:hypothetical protein [Micromonospora sp. NPDC001898]|uniref:hypothetical protein n=1 Tax=Micromonospora sp. NPDC001898 TaxID=3364221 RepID=UPI0036796BC2